jgi:hypothetical protein
MWRWAAVIALLALLTLLLTARRAPPRQIADNIQAHTIVAGAGPRSGSFRVNTVSQHAEAQTPGAVIADELCGMKGPDLRRAAKETIGQHVVRVTQTVISGWTSSLVASEDPRRQAIGLALEDARPGAPGERGKDTPVSNNLVLLAIETNDPVIYELALGQCGDLDQTSGPCQALSLEHWASIDPDNAVPWLWIAAKASSSGDQQGAERALAKASMASRFDEYTSTVSMIALSALPRDIAPLDKAVAGSDVISSLLFGAPPPLGICSDTAVQQPLRKQQCIVIANGFAEKGSAAPDAMMAWNLARKLGFPADRLAKLEVEARSDITALTAHDPWTFTDDGSGYALRSSNFRCNTVLGYDKLVDALQAADGNWRAALAAVGRTAPSIE